jgi:hypothetical protein
MKDALFLIAVILGSVGSIANLVSARRLWRAQTLSGEPPSSYPLAPSSWLIFERSRLTIGLAGLALSVGAGVAVLATGDGPPSPWLTWTALPVVVLTFGLDTSVMLLNRPKFLVPPAYRALPGTIGEWEERHRKSAD